MPSSDSWKQPANCFPTQSAPAPGILLVILRRVGTHRPGRTSPLQCGPPPLPGSSVSYLTSSITSLCKVGFCSDTVKVQTFFTWDRKGGGGYPPPVPMLCTTHGSERNGPGGWSKLRPSPYIPILFMPPLVPPWVRIPGRFGFIIGRGRGEGGEGQFPLSNYMLYLTMYRKISHCKVHRALGTVVIPFRTLV